MRQPRFLPTAIRRVDPRRRPEPPCVATKNTHGTGCSLSSAIAARLATGDGMETAVRNAKAWVSAAIAAADRFSVGHGHGPVHHFSQVLLAVIPTNTAV